MKKLKKSIIVLLIVFLMLFGFYNRSVASSIASDDSDRFIPVRDTSVMEDPSLEPENDIEETIANNNKSTDTGNQNQYFAVGIVLLLVGASCALIIIKMAKNKKGK